MKGRPKSKKEVLSVGLTVTVTKTEKMKIDKIIGKNENEISVNQFFRDLLNEKFKKEGL